MKFLKNSIAIIAFVAAGFAAVAFNAPQEESANIKRALDPATKKWVTITGQIEGQDYRCDAASTICTAEFNQSGQMVPNSQVEGEYEPL